MGKENGDIVIDMQVNISCDLDVELTALKIPVGITKFVLKGDIVVMLKPALQKPPFFGGIQVYFLNPPEVDIGFSHAARVADIPGLRGAVRDAIGSTIGDICVIPRRIAVDLDEDDEVDLIDLQYPEPVGLLRFTLWSASNLVAADFGFFRAASSDPYVVAKLGIKTWTSPVITKNLNPVWGDENGITTDFLVHDDYQTFSIKVYDQDFGTSDDLIGVLEPLALHTLVEDSSQKPQTLDLLKSNGEPGGGSITISAVFLQFSNERPVAPLPTPGPTEACLSVRLLTIKGLELGAAHPFKVQVQVSSSSTTSASSSSTTAKDRIMKVASRVLGTSNAPRSTEQIFAEGCSQPSHPKEQKQLADAYKGIAINLKEKGTRPKEIAEILEVGVHEVVNYLHEVGEKQEDQMLAKERHEAQVERLSVKQPRFDEVLQLLVPSQALSDGCVVIMSILDKRQKIIATSKVPMQDLLVADGFQLEGSFATDNEGVDMFGRLRLSWLRPYQGSFWTD